MLLDLLKECAQSLRTEKACSGRTYRPITSCHTSCGLRWRPVSQRRAPRREDLEGGRILSRESKPRTVVLAPARRGLPKLPHGVQASPSTRGSPLFLPLAILFPAINHSTSHHSSCFLFCVRWIWPPRTMAAALRAASKQLESGPASRGARDGNPSRRINGGSTGEKQRRLRHCQKTRRRTPPRN